MPDEDPEIYNFTILTATLLAKLKLPGYRQGGEIGNRNRCIHRH